MDANEVYTALTRAKKLSQIHLKLSNKEFKFAQEPLQSTEIKLSNPDIGYIYLM